MRGLDGKVAVVAGGGSGIGAVTAARLASEGASVVVGDLNGDNAGRVADEIADSGGKAVAVTFDIATEAGVDELISTAVSTFGGVDFVHVNAADLSGETIMRDSDAEAVPLDVFDRTIAVNLRGHLLTTRRAIPELLARGGGAIVYTSSAAAFAGEDTRPSYAMSKAGLGALVRHVASKWGREGIRANAVAPGLILTEAVLANPDPALREYALGVGRSNRLGRPDDIAAAVAFLFSEDGEWIVGQVISVDGGSILR
jgi:NAD(P)-dependent dehydrogenase (short-subunit alcohol dehydrogenase family)